MIFTPTNFINGERKMKNKSYSFREDPYKIEKLIKATGAKRNTEAIKITVEFFLKIYSHLTSPKENYLSNEDQKKKENFETLLQSIKKISNPGKSDRTFTKAKFLKSLLDVAKQKPQTEDKGYIINEALRILVDENTPVLTKDQYENLCRNFTKLKISIDKTGRNINFIAKFLNKNKDDITEENGREIVSALGQIKETIEKRNEGDSQWLKIKLK